MNIDDIIKSQSGEVIANPNYKKSSKTFSPKYIRTTGTDYVNRIPNLARQFNRTDRLRDYTISPQNVDKIEDTGLTINPNMTNTNDVLAEQQSAFSKIVNSLGQTLVSEIGLGTVGAVSTLFDVIGDGILTATSKIGLNEEPDHDYTNPITDAIENLKEYFNTEVAPIYVDEDVDIFHGGLTDIGWYAKNIPSIASSLTLLIPSKGVTAGLASVAKSLKLTSGTRKLINTVSKTLGEDNKIYKWANNQRVIDRANALTDVGVTAAVSRTLENYQEARGVYQNMYGEAIQKINEMSPDEYTNFINNNKETLKDTDVDNKDDVAKKIAEEAANQDFRNNYINGVFDVLELYALRNKFGNKALDEIGSFAKRKAQRESIKYAGKTTDEIAELKKAEKFVTKTKDFVGDLIFGSKLAIGAQLSEGVEEAINFISQEEGMHLGRYFLGTEKASSFDSRLSNYMNNPQLWESAFWGVAGGVVFQQAGSLLNRVQYTLQDKRKQKKDKETSDVTKEDTIKPSWLYLNQLPEVERGVNDIRSRSQKLNDLRDILSKINSNVDPFHKDENGKELTLNNEVEVEAARNLAINDFITDLGLQSLNNGTFKLTKAYLEDDNVRKAMVKIGIVDENDSINWQKDLSSKLQKVKDRYDANVLNISSLSDGKSRIPAEYILMAASQNVRAEFNIDNLREQQQSYLDSYNKQKQEAIDNNKLNPLANYEDLLRLQVATVDLMRLYDIKREIQEDIKKKDTLSKRVSLDNINTKIKNRQADLYTTGDNLSLSSALFALSHVVNFNRTSKNIDKELEKSLESAVKNNDFTGVQTLLGAEEIKLDEDSYKDVIDNYNKLYENYSKNISGKNGIESLGKELSDNYKNYIRGEYLINDAKSNIISTKEEFNNFTNVMNNTLSEMRINAINSSYDDILDLSEKYGTDTIRNVIISDYYKDGSYEENTKSFDAKDKETLDNALKVLNFANPANVNLYDNIDRALQTIDVINEQNEEATNKQAVEETDTEETSDTPPVEETTNKEIIPKPKVEPVKTEPAKTDKPKTDNKESKPVTKTEQKEAKKPVAEKTDKPVVDSSTGVVSKTAAINDEDAQRLQRSIYNAFSSRIIGEDKSKDFSQALIDATDNQLDDIKNDITNSVQSRKELIDKYGNDYISQTVDEVLTELKDSRNYLKENNSDLDFDSFDLSFTAKLEEPDNEFASKIFVSAIDKFVEEYAKTLIVPKVDGKYLLNMRDILRICNRSDNTSDTSLANSIYQVIKNYLLSEEGSKKYILEDYNDVVSDDVIINLNKSIESTIRQEDRQDVSLRVNIEDVFNTIANSSNSKLKEDYNNAMRNLNVGDTVTVKVVSKNLLQIENKGVVIGSMAIPQMVNNYYNLINNDWIINIRKADNTTECEFKNFVIDVFTKDGKDYNDLRQIIIKNSIIGLESKSELISAFKNNSIIKNRKDLYKDNPDYNSLLLNLSRMYKYIRIDNTKNKETNIEKIKSTIESFFNNLYNTYDSLYNLTANTNNAEVTVNYINEGNFVRYTDNHKIEDISELPLASKALADIDNSRLSIVDATIKDNLIVSKRENQSISGFSGSSTLISVYSRNKYPNYAHAVGLEITRDSVSSNEELENIGSAIYKNLQDKLEEVLNSYNQDSYEELFNEIKNVISNIIPIRGNNNKIPLFRAKKGGFKISDTIYKGDISSKGINIDYVVNNKTVATFTIFNKDKNYNRVFGYKDGTEKTVFIKDIKDKEAAQSAIVARKLINFIMSKSTFNIDAKGINLDNDRIIIDDGFITKTDDGKLRVRIASNNDTFTYDKVFDSYNDFLIKNDFVRVDAAINPVTKTNFTPRTENQLANQVLYLDFSTIVNRPAVESSSNKKVYIDSTSNKEVYNKIVDTIETNRAADVSGENTNPTTGLDIFKIIKGETIAEQNKDMLDAILPNKIIFDPEINKNEDKVGVLAYTDAHNINVYHSYRNGVWTKRHIPKGYIVIGTRLVNMLSSKSAARRNQGIRKLIHERIHQLLDNPDINRKELLSDIREIFTVFKNQLDADEKALKKGDPKLDIIKYLKTSVNYKIEERQLEEFLVESMTNKIFFDYLNGITVEDVGTSKSESLFSKIVNFIIKFFSWGEVRDNSLYMKELNILRNAFNDKPSDTNYVQQEEQNYDGTEGEDVPEEVVEEQPETKEEIVEEEVKEDEDIDLFEGTEYEDEDIIETEEYDDDFDDDSYIARLEEPNRDYINISSLNSIRGQLPANQQAKFDDMVTQGGLNITCR